jgi:hypothetical protein
MQGFRARKGGRASGSAPAEEAAQATQEASRPGQDDAAGDCLREVFGPEASYLIANPDLADPLRGFHLQHPGPP